MRHPLLPWLLAVVTICLLRLLFPSESAITILNEMAITIVFALSYNMLLGQGGMLSFGHAVYMGLGGFFAMHLMRFVEYDQWPIPLPVLPLFAGLFGLAFAAVIGFFSTRRAGTTFAMISLGIGELVAASSIIVVAFFGGEEGISGDRTMGPPVFGVEWFSSGEVYWIITGWMLVSAALMYLFSRTPAGRMANAVRDNPERAEFLGYSQARVRFVSFCASGFFAGVAGGLFAINLEIVTEENLNLATSGTILLVTFLGGTGFFVGPIIGAVVFTLLKTVLGLETQLWGLYAGILFVVTVMFCPTGLAGLLALHVLPARLGRLGSLVVPYVRALVPGIVAVLSGACLLEMSFHAREAAQGDTAITLFWIAFDTHSIISWVLLAIIFAASTWLTAKATPRLRDAFEEASTP
ncbi:MAG: branched-chain amino acid ABC transporter permease [Pseudomonadota bacterium]